MNSEEAPYKDPLDFGKLYEHAHLNIYRYIFSLTGGPQQVAEDLTAETFSRAWRARRRFHGPPEAAIAWLLKIARRLVIDEYRRRKVRGISVDIDSFDLPADILNPEDQTAVNEQLTILMQLIRTLPLEKQEMITLRYILGWRVKDIAAHFGITENTASVNIRRSLDKIRSQWPASSNGDKE